MESEIKAGDVVQLNSGGPKMTVKFVEDGEAECAWFDGNEPKRGSYPVESLSIMSE